MAENVEPAEMTPEEAEKLERMKALAVQGSRVFERVESTSDRLADDLPKIRAVIVEGHGLGMCGLMRRRRLLAKVGRIQGMHAALDDAITELHEECTDICKENKADAPQPRGGGNR